MNLSNRILIFLSHSFSRVETKVHLITAINQSLSIVERINCWFVDLFLFGRFLCRISVHLSLCVVYFVFVQSKSLSSVVVRRGFHAPF